MPGVYYSFTMQDKNDPQTAASHHSVLPISISHCLSAMMNVYSSQFGLIFGEQVKALTKLPYAGSVSQAGLLLSRVALTSVMFLGKLLNTGLNWANSALEQGSLH
jgi:hypothetical protein